MVEIIPPFLLVLAASRLVRLPELRTQQTHSDPADTWHDNLRSGKFDVTGLLVLALGLIAPVIYLQLAGSNICCNSSAVYVLFAVSIAPLATFVWIELKVARAPLVPVKVLFTGEVMSIMGTMFFSAAVTAAVSFITYFWNECTVLTWCSLCL
jgi:hypothetical protein